MWCSIVFAKVVDCGPCLPAVVVMAVISIISFQTKYPLRICSHEEISSPLCPIWGPPSGPLKQYETLSGPEICSQPKPAFFSAGEVGTVGPAAYRVTPILIESGVTICRAKLMWSMPQWANRVQSINTHHFTSTSHLVHNKVKMT